MGTFEQPPGSVALAIAIMGTARMTVRFDVLAHIQGDGDVRAGPVEYVGSRGTGLRLEGFAVTLEPWARGFGLRYRADTRGRGDTGWVAGGQFVGTRGRGRALGGSRIELTGEYLVDYDVLYMGHVAGSGDTEWLANGECCGLRGRGRHIGGFAIRITRRRPDYKVLVFKAVSRSGKSLAITASASPRSAGVVVSSLDGGDLQIWGRRAMRGAEGYALINRARPNMCLARGPGPEAMLKHVSDIGTNDHCAWLDDTVPGDWDAIAPGDILRTICLGCCPDLFKGELTFPSSGIGMGAFDLAYPSTVRVPSSDIPVDPTDSSSDELARFWLRCRRSDVATQCKLSAMKTRGRSRHFNQ